MRKHIHTGLTKRERQIMDILYRCGRSTAAEVMNELPDKLGYSTVRTQLRILEEKGHVRHGESQLRYIYEPMVRRRAVQQSALTHVVDTFFEGSVQKAVAALLGPDGDRVSSQELDRIAEFVERAQKGGRR